MSDGLPYGSQQPRHHQVVEKGIENDGQILQIISVDVDAGNAAYDPARRDERQPIPLPPPANGPESLFTRQKQSSMLPQVDQGERDTGREEAGKSHPEAPSFRDAVIRIVTRRAVDEGAVPQHGRLVGVEGEITARPVREGAIVVESVVEEVEGRSVEVDAVDQDVGGVRARRELEELADVE